MANPKKNTPAVWVGGQRRKLSRRPGTNTAVPRSSTMPAINPESAAASLVSSVSGIGAGISSERLAEQDQHRIRQEPEQEEYLYPSPARAIQFAPPTSPFSSTPVVVSPRPVTAGATMTSDGRKKQDYLGSIKFNENEHLDAPHSAPLPPLTPSKAAQFLGINNEPRNTGSPREDWNQDDGLVDDPVVRPGLRAQKSMPLLTRFKLGTDKIKFKEEGAENDSPKPKKDIGGGSHKTKRMFDFLPSFGGSKRAANQEVADSPRSTSEDDDITDVGYRSDYEHQTGPRALPTPPQGNQPAPGRRRRKKDPKMLERMSPITEASFDDLRALRDGEGHNTELEVISEYEDNYPPRIPGSQPRSANKFFPKSRAAFELDDADLSPTAEYVEDEAVQANPYAMHPGKQIDLRKLQSQQATAVQVQSPLQALEARMLDECEDALAKMNQMEADRLAMDKEVAKMKEEHEEFKKTFSAYKKSLDDSHKEPQPDPKHTIDAEDSDDSEGLVSLRSSIDLDEEPTVHVARAITFTRITPGMVKLVDIPPRKNKGVPATVVQNKPISATNVQNKVPAVTSVEKNKLPLSVGVGKKKAAPVIVGKSRASPINVKNTARRPSVSFNKNKTPPRNTKNKASASTGKKKVPPSVNVDTNRAPHSANVEKNIAPPAISISQHGKDQETFYIDDDDQTVLTHEHGENVSPNASRRYSEMVDSSKPKKNKLPRDESRLLVQDWITNYDRTTQRPVSDRLDADVLADREIPPAPFPKTDDPVPFTPPRQSQKHQCVLNGHAFQYVDLTKVPDETAINTLQVRPYLQTRTGVKQHVHVPVRCDRCSNSVNDDIWVCGVAVCRTAVCRACADAMEEEWQARAVAEWKHQPRKKI